MNSGRFDEVRFRLDKTIRANPTYLALRAKIEAKGGADKSAP